MILKYQNHYKMINKIKKLVHQFHIQILSIKINIKFHNQPKVNNLIIQILINHFNIKISIIKIYIILKF